MRALARKVPEINAFIQTNEGYIDAVVEFDAAYTSVSYTDTRKYNIMFSKFPTLKCSLNGS